MVKEENVELLPGEFIKDGLICKPIESQSTYQLSTCQPDPRFQQANISNWCFTMFVDYQRCSHLFGNENKKCDVFKKCYNSICPNSWIEKWEHQIERNIFPRDLTKPQC